MVRNLGETDGWAGWFWPCHMRLQPSCWPGLQAPEGTAQKHHDGSPRVFYNLISEKWHFWCILSTTQTNSGVCVGGGVGIHKGVTFRRGGWLGATLEPGSQAKWLNVIPPPTTWQVKIWRISTYTKNCQGWILFTILMISQLFCKNFKVTWIWLLGGGVQ